MADTMKCKVVSAEQALFEGDAQMVIASGDLGDLGITPGHAPLITSLRPGPVRVVFENGDEELLFVSGGFLEVIPSQITILADTAERAEHLDEAAALRAQEEARRLLNDQQSQFDHSRAAVELAEAVARLRVIQQLRQRRA
ncbi:MAG: F0F1 ATP synthase subunit epsilon [Gammaproteobacteria bacterium]|nr:F0F1 ATP synthase subunit epsilon [Gammaproteobacteria bacterium]HAN81259.1 F0F1 ATP synthase subunit epsilon [Gammaproteobacteria bacterium]|tara:strand:- start:742 stop:1164 length:423 start_codon:yes stop_codon:yes gene_type:complete